MNISPVNMFSSFNVNFKANKTANQNDNNTHVEDNSDKIAVELNKLGVMNRVIGSTPAPVQQTLINFKKDSPKAP